jgi:fructoselysine-6-P-deglycase FrlB-like protein
VVVPPEARSGNFVPPLLRSKCRKPAGRFQNEVIVTIKKELLEIPDALHQMWEEGRPLYDALVRRISWGQRPIFLLGSGSSYPAALSGARAFESLLGVPAVVQRPATFSAYTSRALAVRSLVIVVSGSESCEETLQAAKKARNRGAIVWAVTTDPAGELAGLADATVDCYPGESADDGTRSIFCRHAVLLYLAVAAARAVMAPAPALNAQEEELGKLGRHIEWVLNQIPDAGRALAKQLGGLPKLYITGAGPFCPIALQAAGRLRQVAGIPARGFELLDFRQEFPRLSPPGSAILYLSSSRCGLKNQVHESVRNFRQKASHKILAITDGNDRQLSERADLAVLLPVLTEAGGALTALAFLELVSYFAARPAARPSARRQPAGS